MDPWLFEYLVPKVWHDAVLTLHQTELRSPCTVEAIPAIRCMRITETNSPSDHIMSSIFNSTSPTNTSPKGMVLSFPRMIAQAGYHAFMAVPERIDHILGLRYSGSMIAEATGNTTRNIIPAAMSADSASATIAARESGFGVTAEGTQRSLTSLSFHQVRNFGGIFTYMTSKWALACFTLVSLQFVLQPLLCMTQIY